MQQVKALLPKRSAKIQEMVPTMVPTMAAQTARCDGNGSDNDCSNGRRSLSRQSSDVSELPAGALSPNFGHKGHRL